MRHSTLPIVDNEWWVENPVPRARGLPGFVRSFSATYWDSAFDGRCGLNLLTSGLGFSTVGDSEMIQG